MSRAELTELRAQIDKAIASSTERDRQRALQAAEEAVRGHGFTLADLTAQSGKGRSSGAKRGSRSGAGASSPSSDAKYRNPENPEQTWSGRGRRPQWVHDAISANRSLADLAVS